MSCDTQDAYASSSASQDDISKGGAHSKGDDEAGLTCSAFESHRTTSVRMPASVMESTNACSNVATAHAGEER